MGDNEDIKYTPEEEAEIARIVGNLGGDQNREPVNATLGGGAALSSESAPADSDMSLADGFDHEAFSADDDIPTEDGRVEDISDIIQPEDEPFPASDSTQMDGFSFPGQDEPPAQDEPAIDMSSLGAFGGADADSSDIPTAPFDFPSMNNEEPAVPQAPSPRRGGSTIDQLNDLTAHEPESLDAHEISEDSFVDAPQQSEFSGAAAEDMPAEFDAFPSMDAVSDEPMSIPGEPMPVSDSPSIGGMQIGGDSEDIPDLSNMSFDQAPDMAVATDDDMPEMDIGSLLGGGDTSPVQASAPLSSLMPDMDIPDEMPEPVSQTASEFGDMGIPDLPPMGKLDAAVTESRSDEDYGAYQESAPEAARDDAGERGALELTERELKKLKTAIVLFHPALIREIKDVILNDRMSEKDTRSIVDMILDGKSEDGVRHFLERKLSRKIDVSGDIEGPQRRVVASRSEYTHEGSERRKRLMRSTRIFAIAAVVTCLATILSYEFIYKPVMARKKINEGVALIRRPGDINKLQDYQDAERIFHYVDEHYAKDYMYGYNAYAQAYFARKRYEFSLQKLNGAYRIDSSHIETLNNLGQFYARVPEGFFKSVKANLKDYYYRKVPPLGSIETQLDVSIDFYKKVLNLDRHNVSAMYGIGNAYLHQKQYLKAREYYENILKENPDSEIGYAGLLNLYIERDKFPQVLRIYVDLREKKMMHKIPSPLLGKLSYYFLKKSPTDDSNVRIDHGIQSERIRDQADNMFPAVRVVLGALQKRDPDYPPLYLHYALFARAQKNVVLMEKYLNTAIEKASARDEIYFGALHLLGEYYYHIKEPVKSYKYLNEAIKASLTPAEFTQEDFYFETENIGRTYAVVGNIFYYFFDKVKYRAGDEDGLEEQSDEEISQTANYEIALNKYETAIKEGYTSSELNYNLGRIYYMTGMYEKALNQWLNLYDDFTAAPELMYALGNAFYHMKNYDSARAEYLKMISIFEYRADKIPFPDVAMPEHLKVYQTIASVYNNLGAVYQVQGRESRSTLSYWKSVEYAQRIGREAEFARVNMARAFKERQKPMPPILDENIPFVIEAYREERN